ncbi:MAG TPA: helix-turn-helix transcriptional regulator, partial [Actinocrinis sp.]|uniref:helix-turn-helix transcriptional regulator n=1 Tax=Actinocrinis sp. TaxID=1920516 RepID=UPI002DDCD11F
MAQARPEGFGTALRGRRLASGLTQEELADLAGLSVRALGNLERGRTVPHRTTVRRLAAALGLREADLESFSSLGRAARMTRTPDGSGQISGLVGGLGGRPAQLPRDVSQFCGREAELAQLMELGEGRSGREDSGREHSVHGYSVHEHRVHERGDQERGDQERAADPGAGGGAQVCLIDGPAGVGKSALAVRFAHSVAHLYPDGNLYVDLRGFDVSQPPLPATTALGRFLRALGA